MRIKNNGLSNRRSRAMVFAAVVAWLLLTTVLPIGGGTASSANMRMTLGYEVYYYTDSSFSFQCGYYNSCTKYRTGCLTAHQERWGIACGE